MISLYLAPVFFICMNRKGIEQSLVILLFLLVLVVFSLAERDSKKLDRLYRTAQLIQQKEAVHTAHNSPVSY